MRNTRHWLPATSLMLVWWVVNYGFGALPLPGLQPPWFPSLGVVVTNGLSLAAVWTAAILLRRRGWLGSTPLSVLSGWRTPLARAWWLLTPILLVSLGYLWVGRDGVPGLSGDVSTLIGLAVGLVAVGVSEETASRGLPLGTLTERESLWPGVIITSVVFGLWHLGNGLFFGSPDAEVWWQVLTTTAFGVCYAGARLVVGSIWPLAGLHALGNWTQLASIGAAPLWYQVAVMLFSVGWGCFLVVVAGRLRRGGGPVRHPFRA